MPLYIMKEIKWIYNQPNLKLFGVMKIHKQIGVFIGEIENFEENN